MPTAMKLTADLGEHEVAPHAYHSAADVNAQIIPVIDMASIACGAHAGNPAIMHHAVDLALTNGVMIGAHPGYPDRENFGRLSMPMAGDALEQIVSEQVAILQAICAEAGAQVHYLKPHGALYNDSIRQPAIQNVLLSVAEQFSLPLVTLAGPANDAFLGVARQRGIQIIAEAFVDRRYTPDGELMSRQLAGAVLPTKAAVMAQAESLISSGSVIDCEGQTISIAADCICVHGDNAESIAMAQALSDRLRSAVEA